MREREIKHTLVILHFTSAAENEYQVFLMKKEAIEKSYQEAQLELNVLIAETESHKLNRKNKLMNWLSLPNEISALMERIKISIELSY